MRPKFCIEKYEIKIYENIINSQDDMTNGIKGDVLEFLYESGTRQQL